MGIWWGEEPEGERAGVRIGWDMVRGLQEEDDGVAVSFWMTDTGQPEEEAPIVPVGHKCGESARKIRLTVQGVPADKVWYLVLLQAYLEQGRAKGDRVWCHRVVVTKGWNARTDKKLAVSRGVKELSAEDCVREYDIGQPGCTATTRGRWCAYRSPRRILWWSFWTGPGWKDSRPRGKQQLHGSRG